MKLAPRVLLVVAIGCRPAPVRAPEPPAPVIRVDATTCVAGDAVRTAVQRVLDEHHAERSGLVVEVAVTPGDETADVALRVLRPRGDVGLDRHYALSPADCESAPDRARHRHGLGHGAPARRRGPGRRARRSRWGRAPVRLSLFGGRAVSFGAIGLEVAGTAQRGRVVTRDGLVSEDIPLVRLGLSGTFQIR